MGFARNLRFFQFLTHGQLIQRMISFKISSVVVDSETIITFAGQSPSQTDLRYIFHIKSGLCKFFHSRSGV